MENSVVEKAKKTPKEKVFFGLKIAGNAIFYLLILFILLFSIMNVNAGSKNGGFPNIFGKGFLNVLTNSMYAEEQYFMYTGEKEGNPSTKGLYERNENFQLTTDSSFKSGTYYKLENEEYSQYSGEKTGNPSELGLYVKKYVYSLTDDSSFENEKNYYEYRKNLSSVYENYNIKQFKEGDLLFVDVVDANNFNNLQVGDVITFFDDSIAVGGTQGALNSHRIVYMVRNADGSIDSFDVQGDYSANISGQFDPTDPTRTSIDYDLQQRGDIVHFTSSNKDSVKGVVTGVSYGGGTPIKFVQENWVWIFVIPVAIFLLVEIFLVVRNIMDYKGAKQKEELATDKEAMQAELEAQKEAMREEMRKQLLAELEQEKANKANDVPSEPNKDEEDGNKD